MNKREAAEYLNLSTRAVERAVARGKLGVRYKRDKRGYVALFKPSEVRRYKERLEVPMPRRPIIEPPTPETPPLHRQTPLTLGNVIPLTETLNEPFVPIVDRLTLSVPEASSLSGLSEKFLLEAIRKEKLKGFKDEHDWRIKRTDLDAFVRNL
jgi:excisionase family DNA binding protein